MVTVTVGALIHRQRWRWLKIMVSLQEKIDGKPARLLLYMCI